MSESSETSSSPDENATATEAEPATKSEVEVEAEADAEESPKKGFKEKFGDFVAEYGAVGIVTWFTIFGLTVVGFALAFQFGLDVGREALDASEDGGAVEDGGVWLAAYIAAQAVKPLRIIATFALTPVLARVWKKMRGTSEATGESSQDD